MLFWKDERGKPIERWERKAIGLRRGSYDSQAATYEEKDFSATGSVTIDVSFRMFEGRIFPRHPFSIRRDESPVKVGANYFFFRLPTSVFRLPTDAISTIYSAYVSAEKKGTEVSIKTF